MSTVFVAASRPETGMFGTWGMSTMTTGEGDKGVSPRSPNAPAVSTPTPQTQYPWRCDKCELSFKSKKELDAHMKKSLVHLRCGRCVQGFADEATLQLHIRTTHCRYEKCICGEFVRITMMPAHLQTSIHHSKCSVCGQGFKHEPEMLKHQKACHVEGYCSHCDLWYPSQQQLHKHFYDSYSHSHCVECQLGFAVKDDFGEHLATVHRPAREVEMSPQEVGPSSSMESDGSHDRSSAIDTYTQSDLGEHEVMALDDEGFDLGSTTSLSFSSASSDDDAYLTARTYSTENMHRSLTTAASVVAETSQQELQPTIAMPVDDNCRVEDQEQPPDLEESERSERPESAPSNPDDVHSDLEYDLVGSPIAITPDLTPADPSTPVVEHDYASGMGVPFDAPVTVPHSDVCTFGQSSRPSSPSTPWSRATSTSPPANVSDLRDGPETGETVRDRDNEHTTAAEEGRPTDPCIVRCLGVCLIASTTTESSVTPASSSRADSTMSTMNPLPQARAAGPSWHCRSCGKDPCDDPTATPCGHIFCHRYVSSRTSSPLSTYSEHVSLVVL
ncbi:hypothetical protein C8Q72DRAFT_198769 [Fomitopsis betulina]|nr:hypothetical protein C8Q72DRAFT_198769 [Fomitopsis betulina]